MTKVREALQCGEIFSDRELNQETVMKRPIDTRWGSHYKIVVSLITMFSSVMDVLEIIEEDGIHSEQKVEACMLLSSLQSFEFVFNLHLMKNILGVTSELSLALQWSDQDIVNAMQLVSMSMQQLQMMRNVG
ncbi:hypothetical protein V6N13_048771 [Hibiscus sabdariffa]